MADEPGLLPSPDLTPRSTFTWSIGLRAKNRFLALVAARYTPATRKRFQKDGGARFYMTPEDVAAFHTRFVTASILAAETGDHWCTIQARLKASGVRPFSPKGEDFGRLDLGEDAEKAFPRRG